MSSVDLLDRAYAGVTAVVTPLSPAEFRAPTGTAAWCVQDLLLHVLLDAQRALVTFATPAEAEPDVDAASYWAAFRPDVEPEAATAHAEYVRRASAAHHGPTGLRAQWRDTSAAAVRAAAYAPARVSTQGHVLDRTDFLSTLVVEAAVHHLDLITDLPAAAPPDDRVLAHTRTVLERIAGAPLPAGWTDTDAIRRSTGRASLDPTARTEAGPLAQRFPLLG